MPVLPGKQKRAPPIWPVSLLARRAQSDQLWRTGHGLQTSNRLMRQDVECLKVRLVPQSEKWQSVDVPARRPGSPPSGVDPWKPGVPFVCAEPPNCGSTPNEVQVGAMLMSGSRVHLT